MADNAVPAPRARVRHNRSGDLGTVVPGGQGRIVHVRYDEYTGEFPQFVGLLTVVQAPVPDDLLARLAALRAELQARLADESRDRQLAVEHAIGVLSELLGAE